MLKKKIIFIVFILIVSINYAQQYGGMWIPTEINEKEMKKMGMKIAAKQIFDPSKPSIKDAVVQFDGGCTAELISPKGLLLTNHHCGYDNIQRLSTLENDLLTNGFWASNMSEELPNPGLTVDFVVDIKEVTEEVLMHTEHLDEEATKTVIQQNIAKVQKRFNIAPYQKVVVKPVYYGNKYYAYVIETFKDIRLVGTPPQSIGKFGSDTDNWVWPRHTGDFMLFRIYADKNNKPAEYSKDNVPYQPKYFLPISIKEKKEGDFTFVFGFPGRTQEYLPAIAVEKIMNETNPARVEMRDASLKILDQKMRADDATRIKYASKYASIANAWKKWIGETKGLKKSNAVAKKKAYEAYLIKENPAVANILAQFDVLYNTQAPYALNNAYYFELIRNAETLSLANYYLNYLVQLRAGNADEKTTQNLKNRLSAMYKDYDAALDAKVSAKLLSIYVQKIPANLKVPALDEWKNEASNLVTMEAWSKKAVITGGKSVNGTTALQNIDQLFADTAALRKALIEDPYVRLIALLRETYLQTTNHQYLSLQKQIDSLQKVYMASQLATDKQRKFFPDANSTLRVTYGTVQGSQPADAIQYHYQTYLDGKIEKYIPADYEFDLPQKLIDLYNAKDYGIYKNKNGKVPLAFTATNHTTGGNSGSPALDAYGNLIGLNFDRQWEGTMSDINYDAKFSRNIMVDSKYILFIIDKFANAKWLLDEMKIIK